MQKACDIGYDGAFQRRHNVFRLKWPPKKTFNIPDMLLNNQKTQTVANLIIFFALMMFPVSVVSVDHVSGFSALIVVFSGMVTILVLRKQILPFTVEEKILFLMVTLLFVSACISSIYNHTGLARADRLSLLILMIPMYIFFKHHHVQEKYIWPGLIAGSLITLIVAIYQKFGLSLPRVAGSVHPILFGDMALLMGTLSLAGVGWFHQQKHWLSVLPVLAFMSGLTASALSLTRGGWVALPFFMLILARYASRHLSAKKVALLIILTLFVIGAICVIPQTGMQDRIVYTVDNLNRYMDSVDVDDPARDTPSGLRFEMWKATWLIFTDNPVVGIGWGELQQKTRELVEQGLIHPFASNYYHAHNQYLSALAKGGLFGFLSLSALLLFPLLIFLKYLKDKDSGAEIRRVCLAGLILVIGFVCFSLTEAILERSRTITFYAFYLSVFMAMILRKTSLADG